MEFKKLAAPSLKELFVNELEHMILSGNLEIGSKLPPERDLAETMGVSRAVVNAGIKEAASKGFVDIKPRSGTYVEDYRRTGTLDTLISIMNYNGGMLRQTEIKSILELRAALDTIACRLIVDNASAEELEYLGTFLEKLKEKETPAEAAEAALDFIHELYIMSGNVLLPLICNSFRIPVIHLWERFCRKYGIDPLYQDLHTWYLYIKAHDTEGALEHVFNSISKTIDGAWEIYSE